MIAEAETASDRTNNEIEIACDHCGLPVPDGLIEVDQVEQFCCHGCQGAYRLIQDSGLGSFYQMAQTQANRTSAKRNRAEPESQFLEYDAASFHEKFVKSVDAHSNRTSSIDQRQITLAVEGIHCAACVWLIEKLPSMVPGVLEVRVNWVKRSVQIRWQHQAVKLSEIAQALCQLGYTPHPMRESDRALGYREENRKHLSRIGIAAALAGNNMLISAALYLGMFSHMAVEFSQLLRFASALVGLAAMLFPGRVFLKSALNAIVARVPHMDLPIALALSVGTVAGVVNVIRGSGEIYFDSLAVLIFLLLLGRYLQFRQQARAADAIEMLYRLTPTTTRKIVDGKAVSTIVDLVEVGDLLEIRPGDLFPVDGKIITGSTQVDESILSGESVAVWKKVGDRVSAGTTNRDSAVIVKVHSIGVDTRLHKIVALVEQSAFEKPEVVQWANKIGGYFVAGVILLASATLFYWIPQNVEAAVDRSIALLIVACPCALALATPMALSVALGRAARRGILIKGADVLQSIQTPGKLWLDKTGTLTEGELKVHRWFGDTSLLYHFATLERKSLHPVAKAIVQFYDDRKSKQNESGDCQNRFEFAPQLDPQQSILNFDFSKEIPGQGIIGQVGGQTFLVGNQKHMRLHQVSITDSQSQLAKKILSEGFSPCWVSVDGKVTGIVALADSLRSDTIEAIGTLKRRNWQVGILSGDHQTVVDRVAKRLGIDSELAIGQASPEEKIRVIKDSARDQNVVMIGDGVNDSAALAAASVGIAVKNGVEASLAAAPVYLAKAGLAPVVELMAIGDRTKSTLRLNLGVSLAYNLTFAALAFAGFINPLVAAILMPISSLTVVLLSFR